MEVSERSRYPVGPRKTPYFVPCRTVSSVFSATARFFLAQYGTEVIRSIISTKHWQLSLPSGIRCSVGTSSSVHLLSQGHIIWVARFDRTAKLDRPNSEINSRPTAVNQ